MNAAAVPLFAALIADALAVSSVAAILRSASLAAAIRAARLAASTAHTVLYIADDGFVKSCVIACRASVALLKLFI